MRVAWWRVRCSLLSERWSTTSLLERALGHSNEQEGVERFAVGRSLLSAKHTARGYSFCALCSTFFSVKSRVTDVVWPP